MNESSSILILTVITIGLALYTLIGARWWLEGQDRFYKLKGGYFALPLSLIAIAASIVAPALLLGYLMNDIKLVKNIGSDGRFVFFLFG